MTFYKKTAAHPEPFAVDGLIGPEDEADLFRVGGDGGRQLAAAVPISGAHPVAPVVVVSNHLHGEIVSIQQHCRLTLLALLTKFLTLITIEAKSPHFGLYDYLDSWFYDFTLVDTFMYDRFALNRFLLFGQNLKVASR